MLVAIERFRQRSEGVGDRNLSISDLCEAEAEPLVLASESKLAGTHETESLSSSLESNSNTSSESVSLVLAVIEGSPSSTPYFMVRVSHFKSFWVWLIVINMGVSIINHAAVPALFFVLLRLYYAQNNASLIFGRSIDH